MSRARLLVALAVVLSIAAFFRFSGLRWDANVRTGEDGERIYEEQHLHPDERFLTMVTSSLEFPSSPLQYFDTEHSTLNPHNRGHGFFAYGTFPIFVVRAVAVALGSAGYDQIHLVGRALSAAAGLATVLLLFLFARRRYGDAVGLLAAFFYAVAALPIQQAHFFTVDEFANPFVMLGLMAAARIQERGERRDYVWFGVALGVAMACKMPVFTLGLVAAAATLARLVERRASEPWSFSLARLSVTRLALAAVVAFAAFRLLQPYAFTGPGLLGMSISDAWWANMKEVRELVSGARDYPPGHQWTDRTPILFPLGNLIRVGLGPALGLAAWAGWAWAGWELWRRSERRHLVPWMWLTIVFLHQGTQWVKSMRYLLPIYPMLALFAAWLVVRIWRSAVASTTAAGEPRPAWVRRLAAAACAVVVVGSLAWAWAFTSIYRRPHSRIAASQWIYANVEPGKAIGNEVWDDPLPLRLGGRDGFSVYRGIDLHNYGEDTPEKLEQMVGWLETADYLVLSSNRLYDSIPRLPMRYPLMVRYYRELFSGELGFRRVAEFTSYPRLLGLEFPDQSAEEAWSVYDHPRVQIFAKTESWNADQARDLLGAGIDWASIQKLWPRDIKGFKPLMMDAPLERAQQSGGTWSRAAGGLFAPDGFAERHPALVWIAMLVLLGAIGFPLVFAALPGLPDRGFLVSRSAGLLVASYLAWLLASLHWVEFSRSGIWLACALALGLALAMAWRSRRALIEFVTARWRLLLLEEVVFWSFFAALLAIRAANPDLWHAARGGEKPMDLAYLTAIVKSTYFPPYDPWFAGGYMNYYYFGFVLAAALIKVTGVAPAIAYNLAVPSFYAMMAAGAFTAAAALAWALQREARPEAIADGEAEHRGWRPVWSLALPGLLGAVLVAIAGNLAELRLIWNGLGEISGKQITSRIPLLPETVRAVHGLMLRIGGKQFQFPDDWWFWSASRAIEHPTGEPPPITEFPFFTFLFADLHAHLMAMPISLLVLVIATALVIAAPAAVGVIGAGSLEGRPSEARSSRWRWLRGVRDEIPALVLLGLAVGALWPTNAWDFPTYLLLSGVALLIAELRRRETWTAGAWLAAGARLAVVALLSRLLFLPFSHNFATAYTKPTLWEGSRTLFVDFLTVHGVFLFFVTSYLAVRLELARAVRAAYRLSRARLRWRRRRPALRARLARLDRRRRALDASALAIVALGIVLALVRLTVEGLAVAVVAAALIEFLARPHRDAAARLWAGMVALAAGLALVVEHLVLAGDIGRMNTVFKSYLQIWTLLGVAAAAAAAVLYSRRPRSRLWVTAGVALVACALLYPAFATPARVRDRFDAAAATGLDGERFFDLAVYHEAGGKIELAIDHEAIAWLRQNVEGSPVVLEASVPPYRWGSRLSVWTGLPTVLGWDWHQRQQRSVLRDDAVARRLKDIERIYETQDLDEAMALMRRYGVSYVYVGPVERLYYPAPGLDKFASGGDRGLEEVFRSADARIYRVGQDRRMSAR